MICFVQFSGVRLLVAGCYNLFRAPGNDERLANLWHLALDVAKFRKLFVSPLLHVRCEKTRLHACSCCMYVHCMNRCTLSWHDCLPEAGKEGDNCDLDALPKHTITPRSFGQFCFARAMAASRAASYAWLHSVADVSAACLALCANSHSARS